MSAAVITVHGVGRYYCKGCGHDEQHHAHHRVIVSGTVSSTPVCHKGACKCGHTQSPRIRP